MSLSLHRYLLLSLSLLPVTAYAQSQTGDTSVAEAAKRSREQKKNAKPVRTLTNDDLPAKAAAAPAGQAAATAAVDDAAKPEEATAAPDGTASAPAAKPAAGAATPADAEAARKRANIVEVLKRTKEELKEAQSALDILQRKTALDSDAYYSKTNYAQDTQGKELLDTDAQNVSEKKSQVDELKAKVAEIEAEMGEPAESPKPAPPQ